MKTFKEYLEEKVTKEAVFPGMLGFAEMMEDESFVEFIEKLPERILAKLSIPQIYEKYLKEKKK
jgi:hypothetical protein